MSESADPARGRRQYLTVPEAAEYVRCTPSTIRQRVKAGVLTEYRLGRDRRIDLAELDAMLEVR